jgi:beta-mannosidase
MSDNYFDILPGETAEITVASNATLDQIKARMKVISLTDAFAATNQPATVSADR